jgi:Ca2+-binding RTX toxin-like protein
LRQVLGDIIVAIPALWQSEFVLNENLPNRQHFSKVAALRNGTFFAVWTDIPINGESYGEPVVKGRLFNADGTPQGHEFTIADGADFADIEVLSDGRVVVSYTQQSGSTSEMRIGLYDATGTVEITDFRVNTAFTSKPSAVTALSNGGFVVAYTIRGENGNLIAVQAFNTNGERNGGEYVIPVPSGIHTNSLPSLTALADGRFAVALHGQSGHNFSKGFGYILTPGVPPSADTPSLPLPTGNDRVPLMPQVATLSDGHLLLAWYEELGTEGGLKIKIVGTDKELTIPTGTIFEHYSILALRNGGFAVAFPTVVSEDPLDSDLSILLFSNTGERIGTDLKVNVGRVGVQSEPTLTELTDGRIMVGWTDGFFRTEAQNSEIRGQIIDPRSAGVKLSGTGFDDQYIGSAFGDALSGAGGADHLRGEGGNDTLDGGTGIDRLIGGTGNDTYRVDTAADVVIETAGGGRDMVLASLSYALSASAEVEVLKLSGISSRTSANLTGSSTANEITGHAGRNRLKGEGGNDVLKASSGNDTLYGGSGADKLYGGAGHDALYGGTGRDVFVFDTRPSKTTNVDKIYDFNTRYDSIQLQNSVFTKLGLGSSSGVRFKSDMFVEGTSAQDAEDRIVYDRKTGSLYYDKDGTGSAAQVKIAILTNKAKLYWHDFYVV